MKFEVLDFDGSDFVSIGIAKIAGARNNDLQQATKKSIYIAVASCGLSSPVDGGSIEGATVRMISAAFLQ